MGKYPVITLQQARQRNLEIKQLIHEGINPKDKKKEKLAEQDGSRLFDTIAQAWYADRKTFLASSTFSRNYSAYMRDVKPVIGHKLIDDITSPDILAIGKSIEARGANESSACPIEVPADIAYMRVKENWFCAVCEHAMWRNDFISK